MKQYKSCFFFRAQPFNKILIFGMEFEIESSWIGAIFTVLFFGYAVMQTRHELRASDPANGSSQPVKSEETRNESLIDPKTLRLSGESEEQIRQPGNCAEEKLRFFQQWLGKQLGRSSREWEKIAQWSRPPRRLVTQR